MEGTEQNACLQNTIDTSEVQVNETDVIPKNKPVKPQTSERKIGKRVPDRSQKAKTKRRKYARSKKETSKVTENLVEDSIQQIPQQNSRDASYLLPAFDVLEKYNFKYEVMSESHMQDSYFMQDKYMNAFFELYPEYLCIDFLCDIPKLGLTLCLFIGMDADGYCEIVSMGLIKSFDTGLLWFCELFKKYNPNWHKVRLIICPNEEQYLDLIKIAFSEKIILVSFFHSLKALKKDLSNMSYKISQKNINEVINIFEKMVFAPDEFTYVELLRQIKLMPPSLVMFFKQEWHQKKDYWSLGHLKTKVFLRPFNKYLFNLRKGLRPLVNVQCSIRNVVEKLNSNVKLTRKEKYQSLASAFDSTAAYNKKPFHKKYSKLITHFATEQLFEQFENSCNVKNIRKLACGKYTCEDEDIFEIFEANACSCNFFLLFSLPCYHIFAIRKNLSLPLLAKMLDSNRWVATEYQNIFDELRQIFVSERDDCEANCTKESERFQTWFKASAELWPLLVDCSEQVSQNRLKTFKTLIEAWRKGFKINIETSGEKNTPDNSADNWKKMYGVSLDDVIDSDNDLSSFSLSSDDFSDMMT